MLGKVGSSQHNGTVVFTKPETTNSPDDCEINRMPANLQISFKAVDLPQDGSPIAVVTGQEPIKIFYYRNCF